MIHPLQEENQALRKELNRLRTDYKELTSKLAQQVAIENTYEESQLRFRTVFEQSRFGCKIITADLLIIQVNPALQRMLGYTEEELVGTKITNYAHPDYIEHWNQLQENLWTKQIPSFQLETCLLKKDGDTLWCSVTSILFRDNQNKLGYTTLEDISQRKRLEEKLQKHATKLNTDLENFVYTASHELSLPITNIEGLTTSLRKKLANQFSLNEEQTTLLSMMGVCLNKLKLTIIDLTEIAKVQKEDLEEVVVSIDQVIDEAYEELTLLRGNTNVKLHKHLEVDNIRIARKHLHSILHNLLSNAIKYRSEERIAEITIQTSIENNFTVIQVEDNGSGISENNLPKLFTMFRRFHTHVEGSGIGLYMSKRMVENRNGRIEVESQMDVGTTFRVFLPH